MMVGDNRNRWTPEQLTRMTELRSRRPRVPWDEVAREVGHPKSSCQQMMSHSIDRRRIENRKAECKALRARADELNAPKKHPPPLTLVRQQPAKPADPEYARSSISTAKLVMDAELRSRIEVMGITGGLLGDPLPGRSALDRRKQTAP